MRVSAPLLLLAFSLLASPLQGQDQARGVEDLHQEILNLLEEDRIADAIPILRRLIAIALEEAGPDNPDYQSAARNFASILTDQATNLYQESDLAGAEPLFREALGIRERILGREHPDYATSLSNLAILLQAKGDLTEAEPLFREALELRRRLLGEEHPDYANSLNNLAHLLFHKGDLAAAEPLFRESRNLILRTLGPQHPHYAGVLTNLANLLYYQGDRAESERLLLEVIELGRHVHYGGHPIYANSLNSLAAILRSRGDYDGAEPLFLEAIEIVRRTMGPGHPHLATYHSHLALLNLEMDRHDSAISYMQRALEIEQGILEQVFQFSSERGMLAYSATLRASTSIFLTLTDLRPDTATTAAALHWLLLRKGAVLSALSAYREVERLASTDPEIATAISRLHDTRKQLATLALNPPGDLEPDSLRQIMIDHNERRESLEASLTRSLSARYHDDDLTLISTGRSADDFSIDRLRRKLPEGGALVEFVRYHKIDFARPGWESRQPDPYYSALILQRDGPVVWVEIDEATGLEYLIRDLREAHMDCRATITGPPCSESTYLPAARLAYERIFAPLEHYLEGVEHLIIAPDGELNQVPFGALYDELSEEYLIERYRIEYRSSGRDLLRPTSPTRGIGTEVFAGPTFDPDPGMAMPPTRGESQDRVGSLASDHEIRDALRSMRWDPLPGALAEADDLRAEIEGSDHGPVTIRTEAEATEDALKAIRSPRILHLATHGFFIPERDLTPEERAQCMVASSTMIRSDAGVDLETGMGRGIERLRCVENPLLRSGIVLAGANAVGSTGAEGDSAEDGWVLAEEITALDLSGTELVVLSACETGLGDLRTGEGVFGLRRAFQLAGAESILMSLFKVPDTATRELLSGFYRRLAGGSSPEEALRESQLELRERYPHPFYWASFVLVGGGR